MASRSSTLVLTLAMALAAGCGHASPGPERSVASSETAPEREEPPASATRGATSEPSPAPAVTLRFDGLYQTDPYERSGSMEIHWLRFYEDGTVIESTTSGSATAEDLGAWFDVGHPAPSRGRYQLDGPSLRYETASRFSENVAIGEVGVDELVVDWHDTTHDIRDTRRFHFVAIPGW